MDSDSENKVNNTDFGLSSFKKEICKLFLGTLDAILWVFSIYFWVKQGLDFNAFVKGDIFHYVEFLHCHPMRQCT